MDESDLIQRGLQAWTEGDLDALEAILDPYVTLRWVEPGPWDCTDRDEVMLDGRTFIISTDNPVDHDSPQTFGVATRITVTDGKVATMQQYRVDPSGGTR